MMILSQSVCWKDRTEFAILYTRVGRGSDMELQEELFMKGDLATAENVAVAKESVKFSHAVT